MRCSSAWLARCGSNTRERCTTSHRAVMRRPTSFWTTRIAESSCEHSVQRSLGMGGCYTPSADGESLPPALANAATELVPGDAPSERRVHAMLQPPARARGARLPRTFWRGTCRARELPARNCPLCPAQPGPCRIRQLGGAVAVVLV